MTQHQPRAARTWSSLALSFLIVACGGGGGASAPIPPGPPPPSPPGVRLPATFQAASVALGQPNLESGYANQDEDLPTAQTLNFPMGLALAPDGNPLVVDADNHRVLLYAQVPALSGAGAVAVLGQPGFVTRDARGPIDGFSAPTAVAVGAGMMAIADSDNHRVLIYGRTMTAGDAPPSPVAVVGQTNLEANTPSCGTGLISPSGVTITPAGKLIVADRGNHRVLVWDRVPTVVPAPVPDLILGQDSPDQCDLNAGGAAGERTFASPSDVWSDDHVLVVADRENSRVLIWTKFPSVDFQAANVVLGHDSFTNSAANSEHDGVLLPKPTAQTLARPEGVHSDGTSLAVADTLNNRVLIWKNIPTESFVRADVVLGHADFTTSGTAKDDDGDGEIDVTSRTLSAPTRALLTPAAVLVSDTANNRVLLFPR